MGDMGDIGVCALRIEPSLRVLVFEDIRFSDDDDDNDELWRDVVEPRFLDICFSIFDWDGNDDDDESRPIS